MIELALENGPRDMAQLVGVIEDLYPPKFSLPQLRLFKYLAISALARSGVHEASETLKDCNGTDGPKP